jgi:translocation and assembly module TamB
LSANPIPPLRHREPPREPIPFPERRPRWQRVLAWTVGGLLLLVLFAFVTVFVLLHNGRFHNYMLVTAEQKLSAALGAQVQARSYTLKWSGISPTLDMYGVVVSGAPPYADPPLLTADHLHAEVRVTSLVSRTWYLNDVTVDHPVVRVFFDKNGASNLPTSKKKQPNSQTDLFSLGVRHAQLSNGELYYNDRKSPLEADLHDLTFQAGFDPAATKYSGTLSYRDGHVIAGTFRPIPHALDAAFSATREAFTLDHAALHSGNSVFNLQATVTDYSSPTVDARYDATLDAGEFRYLLRNPSLPTGVLKAAGTMKYANPENRPPITAVILNGQLSSGALTVRTPSFTGDIRSLATQYSIADGNAVLSNIRAALLGGTMRGDLNMRDLAGNTRSTLHAALRDISLAALKSTMASSSPSLRQVDVRGGLSATADAAWGKTMNDLVAHAEAKLDGSLGRPNGETIPMNGVVHARYAARSQRIALDRSYLRTPQSSLTLNGSVSNS